MMTNLIPYPAYKDSGMPWLGQVPEHWEVRRTKTLLRERVQKGFPDEPLLAATQTKGVVRKDHFENRTVLPLKDLHLLKLVRIGDFVISLRSFQGGIEYAREQGIISPAYTVLYPTDPETHGFLAWLFKSSPYIDNLVLHTTGIRQGQNIDYEKLSRSVIPLPPKGEQTAIVRFLDYMERRMRRYIRAKQKLIKLLEGYKQALIHQAVTGKIDVRTGQPYSAYKPSGVAWLGEVPTHWEVLPFKRYFTAAMGQTILASDLQQNGEYPVLSATEGDIYFGRISSPKFILHSGDFVIPARGVSIGSVKIVGEPCVCTQTTIYAKRIEGVDIKAKYVFYLLNGCRQWLFEYDRTAIPQLTVDQVRNNPLIVPPLPEQTAIAEYLDAQTAKIDTAIAAARREIELLREYRERLIADVVTGKVDVREVAERLPEEPPEQEAAEWLEEEATTAEAKDEGISEESDAEAYT